MIDTIGCLKELKKQDLWDQDEKVFNKKFLKWSLKNHPDKLSKSLTKNEKEIGIELYKIILNCRNFFLENFDSIKSQVVKQHQPSNSHHQPSNSRDEFWPQPGFKWSSFLNKEYPNFYQTYYETSQNPKDEKPKSPVKKESSKPKSPVKKESSKPKSPVKKESSKPLKVQ